MRSTPPCSQ